MKSVETEKAYVISKRSNVMGYKSIYTKYYITFQTENKIRLEFSIEGTVSGSLVEGDWGWLSYSNNELIRFEKIDPNALIDGKPLLFEAVIEDNINEVHKLLDMGSDVNFVNSYGTSSLLLAIENNNIEIVKILIENGCRCNIKGDGRHPPLLIAFNKKNYDMAKLLIKNGMDINIKTYNGETPLNLAISHGDIELIEWLIENGADVNFNKYFPPIITAFRRASFTNEIVKKIVEKVNNDIRIGIPVSKDDSVWFTCRYHPDAAIIRLLIDSGANLDAKNQNGIDFLRYANDFKRDVLMKCIHLTALS